VPSRKNPHAVALGKRGGKAKTPAKARSSARNGLKGGRPSRYRLTRAGDLQRRDSADRWLTLEPPYDEAAKAFLRRHG